MPYAGDIFYNVCFDEEQLDILIMMIDFVLPYYQNHPNRAELERIKNKLEKAYGLDY